MKKNDYILIGILLILSLAVSLSVFLKGRASEASVVVIAVDGNAVGSYSLREDREIPIDNEYGHNLIVISDGKVFIGESDCDGRDCIAMGSISKGGDRIVCLPHRLEVYIKGGDGVDTVAY